jgi:hypothetical protein
LAAKHVNERNPELPNTRTHTGQGDWHLEISDDLTLENVTCSARTRGTTRLSAAGLVAMVGQANSYYTSGKVAALIANARTPATPIAVHISRDHVEFGILPADRETVQNALSAILVVPANLTNT